jgi:hypothetical protein
MKTRNELKKEQRARAKRWENTKAAAAQAEHAARADAIIKRLAEINRRWAGY